MPLHAPSSSRLAAGLLVLALAATATTGCGGARPQKADGDLVPAPEAERDAFPVTVFTNDAPSGEAFLEELRERGYVHEGGEVLRQPNDSFNVKWGAAPLAYVLELAGMVEARYGRRPRLLNIFGRDDPDIFLNVPLGSPPEDAAPGEAMGRASLHVVVFSHDPVVGRRVLERLEDMGYTNPENMVQGKPNPEFNVKWGAAPRELVEEIVAVLEETFRTPFELRHEFGPDDPDLFINLPVEGI
ncbi:MAG: hypothetical protein ACQEXJ_12300 [Myxococcota bacterium]